MLIYLRYVRKEIGLSMMYKALPYVSREHNPMKSENYWQPNVPN